MLLMTSLKRNKKNQTISFEDDIHAIIKEEANKHYKNNFSSALNSIIRYTLGLDDEVKKEIAIFAEKKYSDYKQKSDDEKGFYKETFSNYSKQYEKLFELFMPTTETVGSAQRVILLKRFIGLMALLIIPSSVIVCRQALTIGRQLPIPREVIPMPVSWVTVARNWITPLAMRR